MLDVAHAGEYCLASSSDAAAAVAAAAAATPVDVAAETQLVGDMEALLQVAARLASIFHDFPNLFHSSPPAITPAIFIT